MGNSLLAYNEETEGPIKGYKYPLSDKAKEEIKKQEEEEEEENYPSPIAMGLLGAGASMLRQSGWRDTPITLGEQIGHAIPHGMQAYYQQELMNQQDQAALAQAEIEQAEADNAEERRQAFRKLLSSSGLGPGLQQLYMEGYYDDPKKAWEKLEDYITTKKNQKAEKEKLLTRTYKKDKIPEEFAHMADAVPDGGYLKVDKDNNATPLNKDMMPTNVEKKAKARLPGQEPRIVRIRPVTINGQREEFNVWADPVLGVFPPGHEKEGQLDPSKFWETAKSITYQESKPPKGDYGTGGDGLPKEVDAFLSGRNIIVPADATSVNIDDNQNVTFQTPDGEEPAFWTKDQLASKYPTLKKKLQGLPEDAIYRLVKDAQGGLDPVQVFKDDAPKTIIKTMFNEPKGYFEEVEYLIGKNGRIDLSSANIIGTSNVHTDQKKIYRKFDIETGRYENIERNLRTEKEINLGPASAKHLIPNDYLQAEVEKKRLDNLRAQFPALLKELKEKYEVGDTEINRLTKEGVRNIDSAWHEATAHITDLKPYKFYGDIKRGDELNEIIKMTGSEGIAKRKDYDIKTGQKMFTPELLYRLTKEGEWVDMNHDKNKQLFSDETSLRKEYNLITKDVRVAGQAYMGLLSGAADNTGIGDIMIITSFRRMFEPDSVVREGEFAITEAAQGTWNQFLNTPEKFLDGNRLKPETRQLFVQLAIDYMAGLNEYFGSQRDRYRSLADRYKMRDINTLIHDPLKGLPLTDQQRMDFQLNEEGYMKKYNLPTFTGKRYTGGTDEQVENDLAEILAGEQFNTKPK